MRPASGRWTPVRTLMSVDLPAPFWPITAWTSPGKRRKSTPRSAWTPEKRFEIPCTSSTGIASLTDFTSRRPSTSILPVREFLGGGLLREPALLGDDALGHRLAGHDVLHGAHQLRPQKR